MANDPESIFLILRQLMKIEGAALNLRGVVLEMMVAQTFANDGYYFDLRRKIWDADGNRAEIDIKAENRVECVCVECKAPLPGNLVGKTEVQAWVDDSLPRIKEWLKGRDSIPNKVRFEFITATGFDDDAHEFIAKIERTHLKQPVKFYTGLEVANRLRKRNLHSLLEIYHEHFGVTVSTKHGVRVSRDERDPVVLAPPVRRVSTPA